jgi:hypothetical protein
MTVQAIRIMRKEIIFSTVSFLSAYFPYFEKIKVGLCVSTCLYFPPLNFSMSELIFMTLGMHIMAPELITTAFLINPSHQPACLYVYPFYRC